MDPQQSREVCVSMNEKLILQKNLGKIRDRIIVLCHGCYDILTHAHIAHLEWAKMQGDILVVSITSDAHVARHKEEGKPHFNHTRRAEVVGALNCVDHVVICRANSAVPVIKALRPHVYVKGEDTKTNPGDHFQLECNEMEALGGRVLYSPASIQAHTSEVRARLLGEDK
jgi:rfaE bifunctional protein nucleotidyltransferase chain/domain